MRVVLDTNVLIGALITQGTRALILDDLPDVNVSPDSKDNPILATAIAGKVDMIVSGDKKHMLALGEVEGIPVLTAREALERLGDV